MIYYYCQVPMHALRECFQSSVSILNIVNAIDLYKFKAWVYICLKEPFTLNSYRTKK